MVSQLHKMGFKITVWITPFATSRSQAFKEGSERGYWVKGGDKTNPALVEWWNVRIKIYSQQLALLSSLSPPSSLSLSLSYFNPF
jgi:hypothetical protein